jgi:hypothetical protein
MTTEQDMLRARWRASMTATMPDYSADSEEGGRVGKVIGKTAGQEERKIRASDSSSYSTDKLPNEHLKGPNFWLWFLAVGTSLGTVLLGLLAYLRHVYAA